MGWSGQQIKDMRKQMGWSAIDLARRLGCEKSEVLLWEEEQEEPPSEVCQKLNLFESERERFSRAIGGEPLAESVMKSHGLGQVSSEDLENLK